MTYNQKIPPFKWFILENFPYIEEDFDALTNWQLFCKLGKEMNKIIEKCNLTGEQVERLTTAFNELKQYVDDYFENLDIQDEVNTKLDEMAESGELADLIAQYLEAQAIIGFNTNSSLAEATNLANGSFARTYGKETYNDGKGAFYKIRTRTNADVPDGDNIIVLTETENLVAEKMPDYRMTQAETNISSLQNQVYALTNKKWLIVGDSYSQGTTGDGVVATSWSRVLKNLLGYDDSHWRIADHGGASFANSGAYLYNTILNNLEDDDTITDILIAGGYNDITISRSAIISGIGTVKATCSEKFPNAKVHAAFIGGTMLGHHGQIATCVEAYMYGFNAYQIDYWPNLQYVLYDETYFSSDNIHPNQSGYNMIARALYQAMQEGGYKYCAFKDLAIDVPSGGMFNGNDIPLHLYSCNDITYLSSYSATFYLNSSSFNLPNDRYLNIGKIKHFYGLKGTQYYQNQLLDIGKVIIHCTGGYYDCPCKLTIDKDGYVKLYITPLITDSHNAYQSLEGITQIQLPFFTINYPTIVF